MFFVYATIIIVAFLILLSIIISVLAFKFAVTKKGIKIKEYNKIANLGEFTEIIESNTEKAKQLPYQDLYITSYDGLKLHGFFIPAKESKRLVIAIHGFRGGPYRDFSLALNYYHNMGCSIFIPEQRTHGQSEGKYITYGIKEHRDCISWVEFICEKYKNTNVYLDGISMGATTVLLASGFKLPDNIKGIIADCGFTSPNDIFEHVLRDVLKLPKFPIYYMFKFMCKIIADFDIDAISTVDSVKNCKIPILFAHGKLDKLVPYEMTLSNYESCNSKKYLLIADKATHGVSFLTNFQEYNELVTEFLENCENK